MFEKTEDSQNTTSRSPLFYSLIIMISASLVMIAAGGSRGAFGVFFKPMANDLGWSSAEISGTFTFSMIIEGIVSAVSGWLSDKFGPKIVLVAGGLISGAGFILMSQVHTMWQMYLIYGLAMGIGLGGVFVPVVSAIAKRFVANRSLMNGIALSANGMGQMLSPLIAHQLITSYDWRTAYIILGVILFILIVIPAQFQKRPRKQSSGLPQTVGGSEQNALKPDPVSFTFEEARRTKTFWMMIGIFGFYGFCLTSVSVHLVPYAIEVGLSASTAANILACLGGATIIGRLGLGSLADRVGNRRMVMIGLITVAFSFLWVIQAKEAWALFLFAIVNGIGSGGITSSNSPLSAKFFGAKSHGSTFGVVGGTSVVIGATGPFIIGYLFDLTGEYFIPFLVCMFFSVAGLIICMFLKPPVKPVLKNRVVT
jgi:MFS family permease